MLVKSLSTELGSMLESMAGNDEAQRKARRAAQVQQEWKSAIERVYRDAADFVLDHTNAVYILKENGRLCVIVYADDSLVRSDIDARQEFIKMALREYGEHVDSFRIIASRLGMKERHPFRKAIDQASSWDVSRAFERAQRVPLSDEEARMVDECVSVVENEKLRASLKAAMVAEMEYHNKRR